MNVITPQKNINLFFYFWSFFIPIASYLIIPTAQGTLPSYILAFLSVFVAIFTKQYRSQLTDYLVDIFAILGIFILLTLVSQLIDGILPIANLDGLRLIDPLNTSKIQFRSSLFSQSLYLLVGILTFVFVKRYYVEKWDKYIFISLNVFTCYAIYEFLYFLIFKDSGDFITNRQFGDHETIALGNQLMTIGPLTFQRANGLAPEPSMFVFIVLPLFVYAAAVKKKKTALLALLSILLSASTTGIIGLLIYFIVWVRKSNKLLLFFIIGIITIFFLLNWELIYQVFDKIIIQKLTEQNISGAERNMLFERHLDYFLNLNILSMLFGLGFGYVRSTDFFSTILINNGLIGLIIFTSLFFAPIIKLRTTRKNTGLKTSLLIIYISMMTSVPEFSFLSIWLILGISYNQLSKQKQEIPTNN
ncbi:hypothetical protein [Priestia aryabhattai]|uniref:hypothetical protein n=1 Tax=Priestia aryabhattai TaxID=412384 RepID=UPI0007AB9CD9|nr:hypothetical protein [Priestia aryabhattai]KZE14008.1 hypothetical protein AVW12_22065 [Priestia aryabhattai]